MGYKSVRIPVSGDVGMCFSEQLLPHEYCRSSRKIYAGSNTLFLTCLFIQHVLQLHTIYLQKAMLTPKIATADPLGSVQVWMPNQAEEQFRYYQSIEPPRMVLSVDGLRFRQERMRLVEASAGCIVI